MTDTTASPGPAVAPAAEPTPKTEMPPAEVLSPSTPAAGSPPGEIPPAEAPAAEAPQVEPAPPPPPPKPLLTVVQAARKAKQQLQEITGLEVATVSAMEEHEGGWRAYVNLVELRRVPSTSDVLATYEAILDAKGELETYKRLRRFLRGQVNE